MNYGCVSDSTLLDMAAKIDIYSPEVEDISLEDEELHAAVEKIESE